MSGQNEKQILQQINLILDFDVSLLDDTKFQTLSFETDGIIDFTESIKQALLEFKSLIDTGKVKILDGKAEYNDLVRNVGDFRQLLSNLQSFDLKTFGNRNQNPSQFITGIETDLFFNGQELIRKIGAWLNAYKNNTEDLAEYARQSKIVLGEIERMRDSARDDLSELGVSVHAINYGESAQEWKKSARVWLIVSVILQALSLSFVVAILIWLSDNPSNDLKAIDRVPYFAILALLYSAIVWCSRNYRSTMHQYSVCKTKEVMLSTFKTFIDAASGDQELKNAVLLEVTKSIFSHIDSGFTIGKDTNIDLSSKILEFGKKT